MPRLTTAGRLWVCWPKESSGVPTDHALGLVIVAEGIERGAQRRALLAAHCEYAGLPLRAAGAPADIPRLLGRPTVALENR